MLAISAFYHFINYRSVNLFGTIKELTEPKSKIEALKNIVGHSIPGRSGDVRFPIKKELNATSGYEFNIDEAPAKNRTVSAVDEEEDIAHNICAEILPFATIKEYPQSDGRLTVFNCLDIIQ